VNRADDKIKVAIVEDGLEQREALRFLISASPGFACVGAFETAEDALATLPDLKPEVVLMDIQLPGMNGIECLQKLKVFLPAVRIMMLTVLEDHERIFQSLAAGATGYIVKTTPPAKLLEAIQDLHQGGAPMSSQIARQVVSAFQKPAPSAPATANLSKREDEVLQLLAQGFLYKEIADKLGISLGTVRTHIGRIYEKLHVHTRTEAILKVFPRSRA
jgi:DNA-binding NarL/FixJ family response regulator